jgi:hypothetical protein
MADMVKVKALSAEGGKMYKSGDHSGCVTAPDEAKGLLGI